MQVTAFALVGLGIVALGVILRASRCAWGWHPVDGRQMQTGVRTKQGHVVAAWTCGACGRGVGVTELKVHTKTQRALRAQVGRAREHSKVIRLVVRPTGTEE